MGLIMANEFGAPSYDSWTGMIVYKSKHVTQHVEALRHHGFFVHGTRMECLKSIMLNGMRESRIRDSDEIFWGCRTLEKNSAEGVYTYKEEHAEHFGGGYSEYTHMFGDGWLWAPALYLIADYEQRIQPTIRKQVVLPAQYVFLREVHLNFENFSC